MTRHDAANPFLAPGRWLKGGIHIHTTNSDGVVSPDDALARFRARGYDFLVFGDHWRITQPADPLGKVLVLPGAEFDAGLPANNPDQLMAGLPDGTSFHFMAIGMATGHEERLRALRGQPVEMASTLAGLCRRVVLAHPYWSSLTTDECLRFAESIRCLEVYNHGCEVDNGIGFSVYPWDQVLTRGQTWDALAVDDCHWRSADAFGGWVMVKVGEVGGGGAVAGDAAAEAIYSALQTGQYYSTMGPTIELVDIGQDRTISVRCSPARSIMFRCNASPGVVSWAPPGQTITEARWQVPPPRPGQAVRYHPRVVRVEVTDELGRKAWSNPFVLVV